MALYTAAQMEVLFSADSRQGQFRITTQTYIVEQHP